LRNNTQVSGRSNELEREKKRAFLKKNGFSKEKQKKKAKKESKNKTKRG
jgi:hypothetical protein